MKKLFIFAALAAPLFFSCAKEMEQALEQEPEKTPVANVAFKASIESLDSPTKADINASNQLVWAAGDQIGVYIPDWVDKNKSFTLVGAGGSTTGGFTYDGGEFSATTATVAYFPWNGTNTTTDNNVYEGTMYFKLPQGYYGYTSGKMLTPLVAKLSRTGEEYDNIEFKHVGAAVKVKINNLPAYSKSIGLSVDGKQIRGDWHINPANAGTDAISLDAAENTSLNDVWLNFDPIAAERSYTFLFPVPTLPASSKLSFDIYDKNDIKVWSAGARTKGDVALGRAEVLEMPALDITPYKQFNSVSAEWTVIGTVNGTNWNADIPMVTDGSICIAKGVSFAAGGEFKVRQNKSWDSPNVAYPSSNYVVADAGLYDVIFDPTKGDSEKVKLVASGCPYPSAPVTFSMDGDMSEWASVPGTVRTPTSGNAIEQVKAYADKDYVYVYVKRAKLGRYDQLWGNSCYYYYGFDLDNDPATGANEKNSAKWEAWCYLNIFGASEGDFNTSPSGGTAGMTISDVTCNGVVSGSIEVEARFPRANFPDFTPGTIGVTVWGSKDAGPASTTFTMDLVVPEPATSVTLDGDMSDWADGEAISNSGSIKEWKYSSDASNLYFYFKVIKSDIKDDGGSYNWKRYIYIALDTDNSTSSGTTYSGAGLNFPGCDALATVYPFRGTVPDGMTYPAGVEFVNGVDAQGATQCPVGTGTDSHVTAYGYVSGDYAYLEIGVPRAAIGSPAKGKMKVQFSYSWNLTGAQLIEIKQ